MGSAVCGAVCGFWVELICAIMNRVVQQMELLLAELLK